MDLLLKIISILVMIVIVILLTLGTSVVLIGKGNMKDLHITIITCYRFSAIFLITLLYFYV